MELKATREPVDAAAHSNSCLKPIVRGPAARGMLPTVSAQKRNIEAIISVERQEGARFGKGLAIR